MSLENSLWLLFFPYSAEVSGMVHLACLFLLTVAPFLQLFWQLFILINKSGGRGEEEVICDTEQVSGCHP